MAGQANSRLEVPVVVWTKSLKSIDLKIFGMDTKMQASEQGWKTPGSGRSTSTLLTHPTDSIVLIHHSISVDAVVPRGAVGCEAFPDCRLNGEPI